MDYKLDPQNRLDAETGRVGFELLDGMRADLGRIGDDPHAALHDVRKKIKKLRGLLRLVRYADKNLYRTENARLRDAARGLSAFRDAGAALETLEKSVSDGVAASKSARAVRSALRGEEREALTEDTAELDEAVASAQQACEATGSALRALAVPKGKSAGKMLDKGFAHIRAQIGERLRIAAADPTPEAMHELRKAVKYHRMHLQLLKKALQVPKARIKGVKVLGELLGDLHDADVLAARLMGDEAPGAGVSERRTIRRRLQRQRKQLAQQALDQAHMLFETPPAESGKALKKAF